MIRQSYWSLKKLGWTLDPLLLCHLLTVLSPSLIHKVLLNILNCVAIFCGSSSFLVSHWLLSPTTLICIGSELHYIQSVEILSS